MYHLVADVNRYDFKDVQGLYNVDCPFTEIPEEPPFRGVQTETESY